VDHLLDHNFHWLISMANLQRWCFQSGEPESRFQLVGGARSEFASILTYLKIAGHVTGNAKYFGSCSKVDRTHAYDQNVLIPKTNAGPGSGNQSDDEMAFMDFYNLIRYDRSETSTEVCAGFFRTTGAWSGRN